MASTVTTGRDGVVRQDGTVIGKVEKRDPDGLHLRGNRVSLSRNPLWFALDADGKTLSGDGRDTRRTAVREVIDNAEPLTVSDVKEETFYPGGEKFVRATVRFKGHYWSVSRYVSKGEKAWTIDSHAPAGGQIHFSNGAGTRYTKAHYLTSVPHDAVNVAAVTAGLLPADQALTYDEVVAWAREQIARRGASA